MNTFLKAICLVIYLAALAALAVEFPPGIAKAAQYTAVVLLGAHALEMLVAFKSIKRYQGPLAVSIALTLLFGFLHWLPLARQGRSA